MMLWAASSQFPDINSVVNLHSKFQKIKHKRGLRIHNNLQIIIFPLQDYATVMKFLTFGFFEVIISRHL